MSLDIKEVAEKIKAGEVFAFQTDTVPGLSCDATNVDAIEKIAKLKNRPAEKQNFIVLVSNDRLMMKLVKEVPEMAWNLIEVSDKPLTVVLDDATDYLPDAVKGPNNSIAVRYVKEPVLKKLIDSVNKPIVSTSANISGEDNPTQISELNPEIAKEVTVWDNGLKGSGKASSIFKIKVNGEFEILRK